MATQRQIVVGGLAVAAASGLLLFVGRQARALEKTSSNVDDASLKGSAFFDAAGDIVGDLRQPVKEAAGLVSDTLRLGRGVVRAPGAVITFGGRAATGGARAFGRGAKTTIRVGARAARGTGRAVGRVAGAGARGAAKVVTTPARAAKGAFRAIGRIF